MKKLKQRQPCSSTLAPFTLSTIIHNLFSDPLKSLDKDQMKIK